MKKVIGLCAVIILSASSMLASAEAYLSHDKDLNTTRVFIQGSDEALFRIDYGRLSKGLEGYSTRVVNMPSEGPYDVVEIRVGKQSDTDYEDGADPNLQITIHYQLRSHESTGVDVKIHRWAANGGDDNMNAGMILVTAANAGPCFAYTNYARCPMESQYYINATTGTSAFIGVNALRRAGILDDYAFNPVGVVFSYPEQ